MLNCRELYELPLALAGGLRQLEEQGLEPKWFG
jgi:hypothetical protein